MPTPLASSPEPIRAGFDAAAPAEVTVAAVSTAPALSAAPARESGGPAGPEPTRFGDWERAGRCIDF